MAELRSQDYVRRALSDVRQVENEEPPVRKTYGSIAHRLPILVHANGLMQTVAFIESKAGKGDERESSQETAYRLIRDHLAETLDINSGNLVGTVAEADTMAYIRHSHTIAEAWVFYKRFVESILDIAPGDANDEAGEP